MGFEGSSEPEIKRLRTRSVYLQLRIPRLKEEIAALTMRTGAETSENFIHELIYCQQHLITLKTELESLELEHKAVMGALKDFKARTR